MALILGIIVLIVLIWRSIHILFAPSVKYRKLRILSLFVLSTFFYFSTLISNLIFFFFVFMLLLITKIRKIIYPIYIYIIFLAYCCITLFYSESLWFGSMMVLKLTLPLLFLMFGYSIIDSKEKFIYFLHSSYKFFIPIAILSSNPIVALGKEHVKVFASWEAGNTELYVALLCIPISLYFFTKKVKYLFGSLVFTLPYFTLIRRTCIGGAAIVASVAYYFKKGIKAFIPIFIGMCLLVMAIVTIPALRERFFGGDKGDMSGLSTKELLSAENVSTSGRDYMWAYVTNKFYVGNEIFGCGLGTMKSYLRENVSGETAHFEILHNDHLHLLIETGIVGVVLFGLFFSVILIKSYFIIRKKKVDYTLRIAAFCSFATALSTLFCMYFSNVLSMLTSIAITFLFIGIFLRLEYDSKNNKICANVY